MFNRILVPVEHTASSNVVLDNALMLAKATGAKMMLLHVLSPDEEGSPGLPMYPQLSYSPALDETVWEVYQEQWKAYETRHLERLKLDVQRAAEDGVQAEFTQSPGMPGKVICDLARSWNADLIVMGSRGRSGLSELLLGSVSNYVTHHAPCSVMLIRKPDESEVAIGSKQEVTSVG